LRVANPSSCLVQLDGMENMDFVDVLALKYGGCVPLLSKWYG
jgi:hypothetical protein